MIANNPSFTEDKYFSHYNVNDFNEEDILFSSSTDIYNIRPDLSSINNESMLFNENESQDATKMSLFKIEKCEKKRGRKTQKESKKQIHSALDNDNIKIKIQTHFLNFVVSFINDCLRTFFPDNKKILLDFNQDKKTNVTKKSLQTYKSFSIKELIEYMGISKKWKKPSENNNKEIIEKLNGYQWFHNFFEKNYLDLFSFYYNDGQPLNKKTFLDKVIKFSKKTKSFYVLLEKYKESKEYINLMNGAKIFFLENNENNLSESDKKDSIDLNENQ